MLGLSYPGGPIIDKMAKTGNKKFIKFPEPCKNTNDYSFSFSGLKTSVLYYLRKIKKENPNFNFLSTPFINDICASFQESVVNVLSDKLIKAAKESRNQRQYDEFLHTIQQKKMKELWDNEEDEAWADA